MARWLHVPVQVPLTPAPASPPTLRSDPTHSLPPTPLPPSPLPHRLFSIKQDPKTQAELLDYAKQGCSMFQVRAAVQPARPPAACLPACSCWRHTRLLASLSAAPLPGLNPHPCPCPAPPLLPLNPLLALELPLPLHHWTDCQDFKDQCEAYVTLYGPLVFNMLVSYLQPDSLCTRLGYCHATAQLLAA